MMKLAYRFLLPCTLLTAFVFYFTYDLYALNKFLWHPDISTYYYPFRQWFVQRLMEGEFPIWNPHWGLGQAVEAWATIPFDIYTPLEMIFGAQYHYFMILQLALFLFVAFYVFVGLGFDPRVSTAGAILYFMTPWVVYFYFYFLVIHSFIANLATFYFVYQWSKTENRKYLFYISFALIFGMSGTKLEFWFDNTALFIFYCLAGGALFSENKVQWLRKVALPMVSLVAAFLVHSWQWNIMLRIMSVSGRAVEHGLLNIFSYKLYHNLIGSIMDSNLWKMGGASVLIYLSASPVRRFRWVFLLIGVVWFIDNPVSKNFLFGPFFIGACIGLALSIVFFKEEKWKNHLRVLALFLPFIYYWCRPERGDLSEMIVMRQAPEIFKCLLSTLVWLGCYQVLRNNAVKLAWLTVLFVLLMREQGQIILANLMGWIWVPTRDNYTLDLGAAIVAVAGLNALNSSDWFAAFRAHRLAEIKTWVLPVSVVCLILVPISSNLYSYHGSVGETTDDYPYYQGIPPVRKIMREINESQTWRIFFADVNRVRGISWGYGSCLLEGLNQVSMYTSLSPTNYKYWSFSNRTGIISDEPFQSYTAEYSEKTMRWLPKVNTFGLGNEMIVNYAVEAKPRTERYSLGLLGVNQIVMEKPFTKLMIENLGLKNIKKVGEPFVAPLTSPVSKRFDGLWVAELSTTLPRAFIIKGMDLKNQHQLSSERAPKFDRETIEVSSKKYHYERVSISKYEPEYVRFDLNTSKDAQLVLLDLDHPFWRAKIDGKDAEITTAFKMFRTLTVPSGEHKIEFYCEIPYLKFWASFSIFCLLGIVLGCVANHLTAKKEPLEKSQAET